MSNRNRLSGWTFASNKNNRPMRLITNATAVLAPLLFLACTSSGVTSQQSNKDMNDPAVTAVVEQFADAVETRDLAALEPLLHPEFRVMATRYPTPDKTSILPRAGYLDLLSTAKIGGDAYTVDYQTVDVTAQNATVLAKFDSPKHLMTLTLLLTQTDAGNWQIISDFPVIQPK